MPKSELIGEAAFEKYEATATGCCVVKLETEEGDAGIETPGLLPERLIWDFLRLNPAECGENEL